MAYVGDDINDLEAVNMVGLGCCPADAVPVVKQYAKYVAEVNGGDGAIRDVVEYILNTPSTKSIHHRRVKTGR